MGLAAGDSELMQALRGAMATDRDVPRRVLAAAGIAWWRADSMGNVLASDGPGLEVIGRRRNELVGFNLWRDWPEYHGSPLYDAVHQVLDGQAPQVDVTYDLHNPVTGLVEVWWARVSMDVVWSDGRPTRGVLVITHQVPGGRHAGSDHG